MNKTDVEKGKLSVIESLAELYPQLYLEPGEEGMKLYPEVVLKGKEVPEKTLRHFKGSVKDDCTMVETPAGEVRAVTFGDRDDFVTFLRIMGERCQKAAIPDTQGAIFLDGIINNHKIEQHKKEYYEGFEKRGEAAPGIFQWLEEKKSFTSDKRNYTDAVLGLSIGPYSGVPAGEFVFEDEQWLEYSHKIRLFHECTHFVCYRLRPGERDKIRDELIADSVGIYAAFGKFDRKMAERFLGIEDGRYVGGRLSNYTDSPDELLGRIEKTFCPIGEIVTANTGMDPLRLALILEDEV